MTVGILEYSRDFQRPLPLLAAVSNIGRIFGVLIFAVTTRHRRVPVLGGLRWGRLDSLECCHLRQRLRSCPRLSSTPSRLEVETDVQRGGDKVAMQDNHKKEKETPRDRARGVWAVWDRSLRKVIGCGRRHLVRRLRSVFPPHSCHPQFPLQKSPSDSPLKDSSGAWAR